MGLLDKIKESLFQGTEKITDVTEKIVEKGKKVGTEGVEAVHEGNADLDFGGLAVGVS